MDIEPDDNLWGFKKVDRTAIPSPKLATPSEVLVNRDANPSLDFKFSKNPQHQVSYKGEQFEYWKGTYFKKVGVMGPGQSFGELALIDKKNTRTATIKSETDVVFLTLGTEQFKKSFMKIEQKRLNKITDFLVSIPLFQSMTRKTCAKLT